LTEIELYIVQQTLFR